MRSQSNLEWGIPVLFTRSGSCVLFEVEPRPERTDPPEPAAATSDMMSASRNQAREELRRLFT